MWLRTTYNHIWHIPILPEMYCLRRIDYDDVSSVGCSYYEFGKDRIELVQSAGWSVKDEAGNDVEVYYDSTMLVYPGESNFFFITKNSMDIPILREYMTNIYICDLKDVIPHIITKCTAVGTLQTTQNF